MCMRSIELIWVSTYGKMEEKHTFWAKFEGLYRYRTELYRYRLCIVHFSILTSVRILVINWSFMIRFE